MEKRNVTWYLSQASQTALVLFLFLTFGKHLHGEKNSCLISKIFYNVDMVKWRKYIFQEDSEWIPHFWDSNAKNRVFGGRKCSGFKPQSSGKFSYLLKSCLGKRFDKYQVYHSVDILWQNSHCKWLLLLLSWMLLCF